MDPYARDRDGHPSLMCGPWGRQTRLMLDAGLGVSPVATYTIWRVDSDYFAEE